MRLLSLIALSLLFTASNAHAQGRERMPPVPLPTPMAPPDPNLDRRVTDPLEAASRGVVALQREGKFLGIGTVLSGDGRIVTALSALAGLDSVDVKYADGNVIHARVGHKDRTLDLALLLPAGGGSTEGLRASEAEPGFVELKVFLPVRGGKPVAVPAGLRGKVDARAREGDQVLTNMLAIDLKGVNPAKGAPIVDERGGVLGVMVQVCKAQSHPCAPEQLGAPIQIVRRFLAGTPVATVKTTPWLGIRGEAESALNVRGVRVLAVAGGSPAEKAGLKANAERRMADLIFAVDGQPIDSSEKLAEIIAKHNVGDTVKLLLLSGDKFREVSVVLRAAP